MRDMFIKYADLVLKVGVNVQKGEEVIINSPISAAEFARVVAERAYDIGARCVSVRWSDEAVSRTIFLKESDEAIVDIPDWRVRQADEAVERKSVIIHIISEDPEAFKGVSAEKMSLARKTASLKLQNLRNATMNGILRWTIAPYAGVKWAKTVFPKLSENEAVEKLWEFIFKSVRLDTPDAVEAWRIHQESLSRHSNILNNAKIKSFHYKNSIGTDVVVEMPKNYIFAGGSGPSVSGVIFNANLPTEEVYSAPKKDGVNGKIVSSMPLIYNGNRIENFWLRLEKGRIVEYFAEKGMDFLTQLIGTDEGSHYLGEIALVGYNSPIQNLKTLFYNTLFDENASCHFAIGRAYGACVEGGKEMDIKQMEEAGLNYSLEHSDFMVGTPDLSITALLEDGSTMVVFKDGDWVI